MKTKILKKLETDFIKMIKDGMIVNSKPVVKAKYCFIRNKTFEVIENVEVRTPLDLEHYSDNFRDEVRFWLSEKIENIYVNLSYTEAKSEKNKITFNVLQHIYNFSFEAATHICQALEQDQIKNNYDDETLKKMLGITTKFERHNYTPFSPRNVDFIQTHFLFSGYLLALLKMFSLHSNTIPKLIQEKKHSWIEELFFCGSLHSTKKDIALALKYGDEDILCQISQFVRREDLGYVLAFVKRPWVEKLLKARRIDDYDFDNLVEPYLKNTKILLKALNGWKIYQVGYQRQRTEDINDFFKVSFYAEKDGKTIKLPKGLYLLNLERYNDLFIIDKTLWRVGSDMICKVQKGYEFLSPRTLSLDGNIIMVMDLQAKAFVLGSLDVIKKGNNFSLYSVIGTKGISLENQQEYILDFNGEIKKFKKYTSPIGDLIILDNECYTVCEEKLKLLSRSDCFKWDGVLHTYATVCNEEEHQPDEIVHEVFYKTICGDYKSLIVE